MTEYNVSKLTRTSGFNPFILDGRKVNNIIFYNEDGQIIETKQGWFGNFNNECESLDLGSIKHRRKVNLTRKENFYISATDTFNSLIYDLWIYVDNNNVKIVDKGEVEQQYEKSTIYVYHKYDLEVYGYKFSQRFYVKTIKTEFGKHVDEVSKELEQMNIKIDSYYLKKLLESYDLVKKEQ